MFYNKVMLCGNLTHDPQVKKTKGSASVAQVEIEVVRKWKDKQQKIQEEKTPVDVDVYGKAADALCQYVHKGDSIWFEGHLHLDVWKDAQTGIQCQRMVVISEQMQFMPNKQGAGAAPQARQAAGRPEPDDLAT